jgi:hypothetical protein
MAVRHTVHADSREECAAALDELCTRMGAVPTMKPVRMSLDRRWIARAVMPRLERQREQRQSSLTRTIPNDAS